MSPKSHFRYLKRKVRKEEVSASPSLGWTPYAKFQKSHLSSMGSSFFFLFGLFSCFASFLFSLPAPIPSHLIVFYVWSLNEKMLQIERKKEGAFWFPTSLSGNDSHSLLLFGEDFSLPSFSFLIFLYGLFDFPWNMDSFFSFWWVLFITEFWFLSFLIWVIWFVVDYASFLCF